MSVGIVAFAFGVPNNILSNQFIERLAKLTATNLQAPIYTQMGLCRQKGLDVEWVEETPDNRALTLRLARGAIRWARRRGLQKLLVVAARPHLQRCMRDLKFAATEISLAVDVVPQPAIAPYCFGESWFCRDSLQLRTRSALIWYPRELVLRYLPMWIYKRIAA